MSPCPACGREIHPLAGRCKHCRADLVARRIAAEEAAIAAVQAAAAASEAATARAAAARAVAAVSHIDLQAAPPAPRRSRAPLVLGLGLAFLAALGMGVAAERLLGSRMRDSSHAKVSAD